MAQFSNDSRGIYWVVNDQGTVLYDRTPETATVVTNVAGWSTATGLADDFASVDESTGEVS